MEICHRVCGEWPEKYYESERLFFPLSLFLKISNNFFFPFSVFRYFSKKIYSKVEISGKTFLKSEIRLLFEI